MDFYAISQILIKNPLEKIKTPYDILCAVSPTWWKTLEIYAEFQYPSPGKIENPRFFSSDLILVKKKYWSALQEVFGGGPRLDVFVINGVPDFTPIEVLLCDDDPGDTVNWEVLHVSSWISVKNFKEYVCEKQGIDSNKVQIRKVDEVQPGIIAFKVLSEGLSLKNAGVASGDKISVAKPKKRVVRFVESDEEADKVLEISVKHYSNGMRNLDSTFNYLLLRLTCL